MNTFKAGKPLRNGNGRASKYKNRRTHTVHGWFDSKGELQRWLFLLDAEKRGEIRNLRRQIEYPLHVNGELVCTYVADYVYEFRYVMQGRECWPERVEDFKGFITDVFKVKAKLFHAVYGEKIHIVKSVTEDPCKVDNPMTS